MCTQKKPALRTMNTNKDTIKGILISTGYFLFQPKRVSQYEKL